MKTFEIFLLCLSCTMAGTILEMIAASKENKLRDMKIKSLKREIKILKEAGADLNDLWRQGESVLDYDDFTNECFDLFGGRQ